jgi:hypothetical protein
MSALCHQLGEEYFFEHCTFPLSKIPEELAPVFTKSERTGPRKFKFVAVLKQIRKALKKAA